MTIWILWMRIFKWMSHQRHLTMQTGKMFVNNCTRSLSQGNLKRLGKRADNQVRWSANKQILDFLNLIEVFCDDLFIKHCFSCESIILDVMSEADETLNDVHYRESRYTHNMDMDGYCDENLLLTDDFHGPPNFSGRQNNSEFGDDFYQERSSHAANGGWNHGARGSNNFGAPGRHYFKPPFSNMKRSYEDADESHQGRSNAMDFGEDYSRRDHSSNFNPRGRGRSNRMGSRGYSYRWIQKPLF